MNHGSEYRVFVVPVPIDEAKQPVDVREDVTSRRVLRDRIDALENDQLMACALAAAEGGMAAPGDEDPATWCSQLLYDALDEVLGDYNQDVAYLHLDDERLIINGDEVEALSEHGTYAWLAVLAESRIADAPLPGTDYFVALPDYVSVVSIAAWFRRHLQQGLTDAGIDSTSEQAEDVMGSFVEEEADFGGVVHVVATAEVP